MTDTTELLDKAEIRDGQAIVAYSRTEAAVAELRTKYQGAKYDLTTTAGDKAARAGRLELVTVRAALEKKRKELKAPALEFGKAVDGKAAELTAVLLSLEQPIDAQIKADETRRENERRAREESEAARRKVHTDAIAKIAGYVAQATELPAERIAGGIAYLEALDLSGFEEFQTEASETRGRTLEALRALHAKAVAREEEAARMEAQRVELDRIAAEQAAQARILNERQAAIDRQAKELEEALVASFESNSHRIEHDSVPYIQKAISAYESVAKDWENDPRPRVLAAFLAGRAYLKERLEVAQAREREAAEALERQQREAAAAPPAATAAPTPAPSPAPAPQVIAMAPRPAAQPAAAPAGPPTLTLGAIKDRLAPALSTDAAGLAALGFTPAATQGAAKLFHERDWPLMLAAMVQHLEAVQAQIQGDAAANKLTTGKG